MINKKILMIAYTNYSTDPRVIREAEAANEVGFKVDFLSLRNEGDSDLGKINNINIYRINQFRYRGLNNRKYIFSYFEFFIRSFFKVTLLQLKKRYNIIHVNNMPDFLIFCSIVPKIMGTKIILDIHDPMPFLYLTKFKDKKKNFLYKFFQIQEKLSAMFADSVITVHEPIKREILVDDGIPLEKIHIVANFADEKMFNLISSYNLKNPIKLIFHGTIAERFGLHKVIKALKNSNNPNNYFFKIIGEGDFSEQLKKTINELRFNNIVDFENKLYPVNELSNILKDYHLGLVSYDLSPATNYMLPVKMMEYISLGIPIVTVKNVPIKFYFQEDDCFYYDPFNLESLTKLFDELVENPDLIIKKRERTLTFREKFLWSNEKQKYVNLLQNLMEN